MLASSTQHSAWSCFMHTCDARLCRDIQRLWKTAEQRYAADGSAAQAAIGPSYSQWQDFPDDVGQASTPLRAEPGVKS